MNVKTLKVADLKAELSKRGLDTKGLKKELADRLQEFLNNEATAESAKPASPAPSVKDVAEVVETSEAAPADAQEQNLSPEPVSEPAGEESSVVEQAPVQEPSPKPPSPAQVVLPTQDQETEPEKQATEAKDSVPESQPAQEGASSNDASKVDEPVDIDIDNDDEPAKVAAPPTPSSDAVSLPSSLSHLALSYPPSKILYISNLRRPLLLSTLSDLLEPSSLPVPPQAPHSSSSSPGLWLSGIKDHAYAGYESVSAALAVAERVHNLVWPDTSTTKLHVQFVDPGQVSRLIEEEEAAWKSRRKLELRVRKEGENWNFELIQPGQVGPIRGAPPQAPVAPQKDIMVKGELRWTRTRPSLAFKEGPGAPPRPVRGGGRGIGRGGGPGRGPGGFGGGYPGPAGRGGFSGGFGGRGGLGAGAGDWGGRGGGPRRGDHWSSDRGFGRRGRW